MRAKVVKVDIKEVKSLYPEEEYPCLEYCVKLIEDGVNPNSKLECWNYEREKPEADWIVRNIGNYAKNYEAIKRHGINEPRLVIG